MRYTLALFLSVLTVEAASESGSALVLKAREEEKTFRYQTVQELQSIGRTIAKKDVDPFELQANVLKRLAQDQEFVKTISPVPATAHWNLKTHKLAECLKGASDLITVYFYDLITNAPISGYTIDIDFIPRLGDQTTIWGNSKGTFLKTALFLFMKELKIPVPDVDTTALYHVTPLPETIDITSCSFYYSDTKTPHGLVFPHSGYAFGGHRGETRYPTGKQYGPQDCSSWIQKITGCASPFSTMDQLFTYRRQADPWTYVSSDWDRQDMLALYKPVRDPQKDLTPGAIYASRNFTADDPTMSLTAGSGGHTALVWDAVTSSGNIQTLGYNRDMPNIEGFGLQSFKWESYGSKKVFYLRID